MDDKEKVIPVLLEDLHEFRGHTFQIKDDESMKKLVESIRENGILTPVLVFHNEDGELELISGHRRFAAAKRLGLSEIPAIVKHVVREDATLLMGDSNFTCREKILPSEKAFTYKSMLGSMQKKQIRGGKATGIDSCRNELASHIGESSTQVQRFIRLTELIPELLKLVDLGRLGFQSAVELSYLDAEAQGEVLKVFQETGAKPSVEIAKKMRELAEKDDLDAEKIRSLLAEQEKSKKADEYKIVFRSRTLCEILANCHSIKERENRIVRGLRLLAKQEQEWEAEYEEEQRKKCEEARRKLLEGGGDTYGG